MILVVAILIIIFCVVWAVCVIIAEIKNKLTNQEQKTKIGFADIEQESCKHTCFEVANPRVEKSELTAKDGVRAEQLHKSESALICERREKWLEIERNRKVREQKHRELCKENVMQQEKNRLDTIQKIKDSLQWKCENGVCSLMYLPIDNEPLYMDSNLTEGVVGAGDVLNAVFRYRNNDLTVKDLECRERGVLFVCVEPFYKHSYELTPGMTVLKVHYQESFVSAYEQEQLNKELALEKEAQKEKEIRAIKFEEDKKQRALQKEIREKEKIRLRLLSQKRRRELDLKVHQEMSEKGELSMDGTKRRYIPQCVVSEVYHRDGAKCVICGATENLQLDHIIPFSKGGSDTAENLQVLCQKCNLKKSNKI